MMNVEEHQSLVRERDEAIERCNQSKLLIEKLEEELKNLKELFPTNEKHFFNMVQKEYLQIIDTMREKMKNTQEKLTDELRSGEKKDLEIGILNEKINKLGEKYYNSEKESAKLKHFLQLEQERVLQLESDLISTEKQLYHLHNKYQYVNDLEEERDKLQHENMTLSKDCNELEFALEVCHQKIDSYEHELQCVNENLKIIINEKDSISKKNTNFKDEVTELKDVILNVSNECRKMNTDTKNILNEKLDTTDMFIFAENGEEFDSESKLNFFKGTYTSVVEVCKSVDKLKNIVNAYSRKNEKLRTKINTYQLQMKQYRNRVMKMNNIISFLKQNLISLQKKLKITTTRWRHETLEIISKMETRIQDLNEKYQQVKHENDEVKKRWKKYKDKRKINEKEVNI